jgi:sulfur carrier protein ThiS
VLVPPTRCNSTPAGTTIDSLVAPFNLPGKLTHLVLINGVFIPRSERPERRLDEGDVVAIWPPVAGG